MRFPGLFSLAFAAAVLAAPAFAETTLPPIGGTPEAAAPEEEGTSLMEQGLELMMRGLMTEMEPAIEDMQGMLGELGEVADQLGPELQAILNLMGDVRHYELPERLPNGDILIRRKPDAPPMPPLPGEGARPLAPGEIEL